MSDSNGTKVTLEELDTGATQSCVIKDDYSLTVDGDCYVSGIQAYPKSGTHVITVKNVGGKR